MATVFPASLNVPEMWTPFALAVAAFASAKTCRPDFVASPFDDDEDPPPQPAARIATRRTPGRRRLPMRTPPT